MTDVQVLPPTYTFGKVIGRVIQAVADSSGDVDDKPEARAVSGTVTFAPAETLTKVVDDGTGHGAFVFASPVTAKLSATGNIQDAQGNPGIWLVTGTYTVSFTLAGGVRLDPYRIVVTDSHTASTPLDITFAAPPDPPENTTLVTMLLPGGGVPGQVVTKTVTGADWEDPTGGGTGTVADATTTVKGVVQLAGDLAGTADAPTVPALVNKADKSQIPTTPSQVGAQPVDSDLTAIAALTTTAYGRAFLALANQAGLMGLLASSSTAAAGIVQMATDAETIAGTLTGKATSPANVKAAIAQVLGAAPSTLDTIAEIDAAIGNDPNFATTMTTALSQKQPLDADLSAIAALASAADKLPYATGAGTWALTTLTAFTRTLLAGGDLSTWQNLLDMPSAVSDLTGTATLAQMAPGSSFFVYWRPTTSTWEYTPGVALNGRPTSRTDLHMVLVGGATPPAWWIADDMHLQESA